MNCQVKFFKFFLYIQKIVTLLKMDVTLEFVLTHISHGTMFVIKEPQITHPIMADSIPDCRLVRYNQITIGSGCRFPIHLNETTDEIRTQQTEGFVTTDRLCLFRKKELQVIALQCVKTVTRE